MQKIANDSPYKNRAIGTVGHNNTVKYLTDYLSSKEMSKYYTFYKQGFPISIADLTNVAVNGEIIEAYASKFKFSRIDYSRRELTPVSLNSDGRSKW